MNAHAKILGTIFLGVLLFKSSAMAESYYLEHAKTKGGTSAETEKANTLIRDFIVAENPGLLNDTKKNADFTLQPNLIKLGAAYVLKIEKKGKDGKVLSLTEGKAPTIEGLDKAVAKATGEALHGKPMPGPGEGPEAGRPMPPPGRDRHAPPPPHAPVPPEHVE